jgi:membrane dipeptidase
MTIDAPLRIFDGHNDSLLRMQTDHISFLNRNEIGGLDLPRAREGGFAGGFFAVYVRAKGFVLPADPEAAIKRVMASLAADAEPLPLPDLDYARSEAMKQTAALFRLEQASNGEITVVRTARELANALENGVLAAVLHFEGAEPIDTDLDGLEVFYRAGLRSLGIVHSRPNAFAHGVPIAFGRSPDTGPGLTDAGRNLVAACNRLRILIDLSHLNERDFWEVADLSNAPLVATHSCAHALSPSTRNLTDEQIRAIGNTRGMIGLNFQVSFLRADGALDADTPLDVPVRHISHMVSLAGIDCVGLGSDYDFIVAPREIATAAQLPNLVAALRNAGFDGEDLEKLLYKNWVRVLRDTWGE